MVNRRAGIVAASCAGNSGGWLGIGFSVYDLLGLMVDWIWRYAG